MKKPSELKSNFMGVVLIIKSISLTNVTFLIFLFDPMSFVWSLILWTYWGLSSDGEFHLLKHSLLRSLWFGCLSKCILKLFSYEKTAQPESLLSMRRWDILASPPLQKSAVLPSHRWMDIKGPLLLNSTTTVVPITHAVPMSNGNKSGQQADPNSKVLLMLEAAQDHIGSFQCWTQVPMGTWDSVVVGQCEILQPQDLADTKALWHSSPEDTDSGSALTVCSSGPDWGSVQPVLLFVVRY